MICDEHLFVADTSFFYLHVHRFLLSVVLSTLGVGFS